MGFALSIHALEVLLPQVLIVQGKEQQSRLVVEFVLVACKQLRVWVCFVDQHPRVALRNAGECGIHIEIKLVLHFLVLFVAKGRLFEYRHVHKVVSHIPGVPHVVRRLPSIQVQENYSWLFLKPIFLLEKLVGVGQTHRQWMENLAHFLQLG